MKAKCAKQKYDHPAEEKDVKVLSPAKEEKKTQVGYSAPYNTSNGRLPTFAGINTSSAVFNTVVNSFGVGTYNFLATTVNDVGKGIGAVYNLANTVSEAVIGMDLDEAAMTMQATGLLAPAGVVLEGVNLWFDTAKMVNGSKCMQTLLSAAQTTVNVGAGVLGVDSSFGNSINNLEPNLGFSSFRKLKNSIGSAGEGKDWHHIVEQSQIKKSGFSPELIHNTSNIIAIDHETHMKITGFYSSKQYRFSNGLSIRDWLAGQTYEIQYEFGIKTLKDFGVIK